MSHDERDPIEASLERMQAAIARSQQRQQAMVEQWIQKTGSLPSRRDRRRLERLLRRQAYREGRAQRSGPEGVVFLVVAAIVAYIALSGPDQRWWMIFIALGLGLAGMRRLARSSRKNELTRESEPSSVTPTEAEKTSRPEARSEVDPSLARVDELCERLLSEVRRGPDILRDVVRRPEETVTALKEGCHALAKRERELRALVTPEDDARLLREREQLTKRLEAEQDEVTRQRLKGALDALDEQRKQRSELLTAASRMEAERTRLGYTLENLYTQVLRVRSADASSAEVAGKGLRQTLDRLGDEIGALAEALASVHAPETDSSGATPISAPSEAEGQVPRGTRERA